MTTQVQLYPTPLSLVSIPIQAYPFVFHGITKLVLGNWRSDYHALEMAKSPRLDNGRGWSNGASEAYEAAGRKGHRKRASLSDNQAWKRMASANVSPVLPTSSTSSSSHHSNSNTGYFDTPSLEEEVSQRLDHLEEFINITLSPVECSVILPTELVDFIFGDSLRKIGRKLGVEVLPQQYLVLQVDGDGQNSGDRVLDVTSPIAKAKVPVFFLSMYFTDYVLIPTASQGVVTAALQRRGFLYSDSTGSYVASRKNSRPSVDEGEEEEEMESPTDMDVATLSSDGTRDGAYSPSLVEQTFETFKTSGVRPSFDGTNGLVMTGARTKSRGDVTTDSIYLSILRILSSTPLYCSVTIAAGGEVSFVIDPKFFAMFPENTLLGSVDDVVRPIWFDFTALPQDSTGIVSSVSSRLTSYKKDTLEPIHVGYLSTAKSAIVMVHQDSFGAAAEALLERL